MGRMRTSNLSARRFSCSKVGRCSVWPSSGMGLWASEEEELEAVRERGFFVSAVVVAMVGGRRS